MFTLNCKGKIILLDRPFIMGILNVTTDSFYEGFLDKSNEWIIEKAAQLIQDGADILDIGGQSTKPGSERIDAATEISRVLPIIKSIHEQFPEQLISIDTYHSAVAIAA
ncbi:MAG: dihydropteroate synthase, partial [Ferruginibacter sp.]